MVVEVLGASGRCRRDSSLDAGHACSCHDLLGRHSELGLVPCRLVWVGFCVWIRSVWLIQQHVAIFLHLVHRLSLVVWHYCLHRLLEANRAVGLSHIGVGLYGVAALSVAVILLVILVWVHFVYF